MQLFSDRMEEDRLERHPRRVIHDGPSPQYSENKRATEEPPGVLYKFLYVMYAWHIDSSELHLGEVHGGDTCLMKSLRIS
jgi:hypothetical protein